MEALDEVSADVPEALETELPPTFAPEVPETPELPEADEADDERAPDESPETEPVDCEYRNDTEKRRIAATKKRSGFLIASSHLLAVESGGLDDFKTVRNLYLVAFYTDA